MSKSPENSEVSPEKSTTPVDVLDPRHLGILVNRALAQAAEAQDDTDDVPAEDDTPLGFIV